MAAGALRAYLDNAATTPVSAAAAEAMLRVLGVGATRAEGLFANPSSVHRWGVAAAAAVAGARETVAQAVGCAADEVVFTSGATESNHLAILGIARARARAGRHVLTAASEHSSVLDACAALAADGYQVSRLPVSAEGLLEPEAVAAAVRPDTILCAVAHVNNEVGAVQPVAEIALALRRAAAARGGRVALHVDGVQALGKVPTPYAAWGVDTASFSAHKVGGPKGVGALMVRGVRLLPPVPGGSQERGLRPGTENVPGIVGFGAALAAGAADAHGAERLRALKLRLVAGLRAAVPGIAVNGPDPAGAHAAPHIVNLAFDQVASVPAEVLLHALEAEGIACSAGSACSARAGKPSHVLQAMGLPPARLRSSLRFSLGPETAAAEVDWAVARIPAALAALAQALRG
jgi:cysteine desulfurase